MTIKFEDVKERLREELLKNPTLLEGEDKITLIDGIFNMPLQYKLPEEVRLNGEFSSAPMIACVGNKSGRVYFFSLFILLPDLKEG